MTDPRGLAELTEIDPQVPDGPGDRFSGYGVVGVTFTSGHVLAFRRFPASSLGYGYSSVWHRNPLGRWTFWSDVEPEDSCARFFGRAIHAAVKSRIRVQWSGPYDLSIAVDGAALEWHLTLSTSPTTIVMNAVADLLPRRVLMTTGALRLFSSVASRMLRAGRVSLVGRAPNGQAFAAVPRAVWWVAESRARLGDVEFGSPGPLSRQAWLGDFAIPQRGLFVVGHSRLAAACRTRNAESLRHALTPSSV